MKRLLIPLLLLYSSWALPQTRADSLHLKYAEAKSDSVKVKILLQLFDHHLNTSPEKARETIFKSIQLAEQLRHPQLLIKTYNRYSDYLLGQSEYDSAITYYKKSLKLSDDQGYNQGKLHALNGLGNCHWSKGNNEKALTYQKMHMVLAEEINDQRQIANSQVLLAGIYSESGDYTKAMELFTLSSKKYKLLNDKIMYARMLSNIGFIQRRLENYENAISYFIQSDSIYQDLGDESGKAFVTHNLAVVFKNIGKLNDALDYNHRALKGYKQLGNKKRVAYAEYTMGEIYRKKDDLNQALMHYTEALRISGDVKDSVNMGYTYVAIGNAYKELNKTLEAKRNLQQALKVATSLNQELLAMEVYESLSKIYASEGEYEKAYQAKSNYSMVKDSFYTKEKRELASEIEGKYQNEQKAKEIALLSSQNNLQTLQIQKGINERNSLIVFALLIVLLAGLLYNQYRLKQRTNQELRELDRAKSNFFANISHEFRTPLTLIKGPVEQLEQNFDEKLSMENVKMIRRNANRLLNMVNQLLDLSKIDEGSLKLAPTEGDVYKCLRAATSSFNSHAAQRNIDYKVKIPQKVFWASFDRDKLENIVYNLLGNAFKFSGDGSQISFVANYDEYGLQIRVSDAGKGIAAEKLPFIFDRFYQVDSSNTREKGGSGIGLSLSKDLVELMDGTITVTSEVGKGTFFTVQLPIQEIKTRQNKIAEDVPEFGKEIVKKPFALTEADKRNLPSILLVEDNRDMRHFITERLIKFYKVTTAVNGEAGLKKAIADSPNLVITDLMMPKMDGIELCKKLKTQVHTSHIPVIMLTAKAGMDNKLEGLEIGADDYLTKPFDGKELLARVKNLIEQRQKLRALFSNKEIQIDPKKVTVTSIDQKFMEQVLALLEEYSAESDFGVSEMQKALAMSKTQLHRKLKALTNEAPGELLRNFRLKRAAQLLSQKADSVTQIAYKVGFNNLSYFAKCFKALYGVAPSSY